MIKQQRPTKRYERYKAKAPAGHRLMAEGMGGEGRRPAKGAAKGIGAGDQARPDQVVAGIGDYGNESMTHTWLIFMPSFRVYGTPLPRPDTPLELPCLGVLVGFGAYKVEHEVCGAAAATANKYIMTLTGKMTEWI